MEKIPFGVYDFFGYLAPGMLLLAGVEWTLGYPNLLHQELRWFAIAVVIVAVYVGGHLVAGPSHYFLQGWLLERALKRPSETLFLDPARRPRVRSLLFPSYFRTLDSAAQERVRARAAAEVGPECQGEPLFHHVHYHDETRKNRRLMAKLEAYLAQYGFARNMAFTCFLVAVALFSKFLLGHGAKWDLTRAGILASAGLILLFRFLKFFRLYSFEMFSNFGGFKNPIVAVTSKTPAVIKEPS